ncbi:hypothetical protein T484DRAFT_1960119 [Baffinella frigidus]|nr:hypothetical protein T484DRAFT_1960119 [Cryptophyta sp. CCMP2293]
MSECSMRMHAPYSTHALMSSSWLSSRPSSAAIRSATCVFRSSGVRNTSSSSSSPEPSRPPPSSPAQPPPPPPPPRPDIGRGLAASGRLATRAPGPVRTGASVPPSPSAEVSCAEASAALLAVTAGRARGTCPRSLGVQKAVRASTSFSSCAALASRRRRSGHIESSSCLRLVLAAISLGTPSRLILCAARAASTAMCWSSCERCPRDATPSRRFSASASIVTRSPPCTPAASNVGA